MKWKVKINGTMMEMVDNDVAVVSGTALNGFPPSKPVPQHQVSRWFGAHMGSPRASRRLA